MNGGKIPLRPGFGYTIVEVLIVLAVSGLTFLMAVVFVSGRQQTTAFNQAVNEVASRLQDVADQVAAGQYSDVPFGCNVATGTSTINLYAIATASTAGTNNTCSFVGKLVHFSVSNDPAQYEVFPLAGAVYAASKLPVQSLADANPTPIYKPGVIDLTSQSQMPDNLAVNLIKATDTVSGMSKSPLYALAFTQSFSSLDLTYSNSTYNSGAQSVVLQYDPSITNNNNITGAVTNATGGTNYAQADQATICLTDGERYGVVTIAQNGNPQSVIAHNYAKQKPASFCT